ncbi:hypothetical protein [Sphaerotilus sp.]|uniref:hypothetical protein n=1 Tax=Sphaerotilus sp. TaxID=2093942 RepID=UPI002ACF063F|nr:hypothetical protein [Sphaerotilus sp.]MDZ7858646.1 hypothetical protein [Sphaerotilus sp.]
MPIKGPFQFVVQTVPAAAKPARVAAVNATRRDAMAYAPLLHRVVQAIKTRPIEAGQILGLVANAAAAGGIAMDPATLRTRLALGDTYAMVQAVRMAGADRLHDIFGE